MTVFGKSLVKHQRASQLTSGQWRASSVAPDTSKKSCQAVAAWLNWQQNNLIGPFECDVLNVRPVTFQVLPPYFKHFLLANLPDG